MLLMIVMKNNTVQIEKGTKLKEKYVNRKVNRLDMFQLRS